jgi:hypothetical protein
VQSYASARRGLPPDRLAADPSYTLLLAQAQHAQAAVLQLEDDITTLQRQLAGLQSGGDPLFSVQDPAALPTRPVSRILPLLLAAMTGLAVAIALASAYLALVLRLDPAIYTGAELGESARVPILLRVPHVGSDASVPAPGTLAGRRAQIGRARAGA